jgi:hypothetical protein
MGFVFGCRFSTEESLKENTTSAPAQWAEMEQKWGRRRRRRRMGPTCLLACMLSELCGDDDDHHHA